MKKLSVLFAAVLMMFSLTSLSAQKIAHADIAGILDKMPEMKKAQDQLEALGRVKDQEITKLQQDWQGKVEAYNKAGKKDEAQENTLQQEANNIQKMGEAARKDLMDKQNELFAPIDQKLQNAVDAVAKAKGVEYIFDANSQALIFKGGLDVTADILKQMGL